MWQKRKTQLVKFDQSTLRVICFRWEPAFGCWHVAMSRPERQLQHSAGVLVRVDHVASIIVNADHGIAAVSGDTPHKN